jgi:hypothetical protein
VKRDLPLVTHHVSRFTGCQPREFPKSHIFLAFTGIFAGYWKIENQAIEG